jgi:hypothetical protein
MTDKKNEIIQSNEQWINTPFSFTKIDKQYSLSQQHVLFCVSSHLQEYVTRFFNEKREKGGLRSDYLFEVDKEHVAMNVPKIRLKLNELGIDSSHYKDLRKALKELLDFSVRIKIDGKVVIQHVFSNITEDVVINGYTKEGVAYDRSKGEVELKIDPVVAKYAFDMSQGFIHHMAMIARYANRANTPRIYLFLLRQMGINKGKMTFQVPFMALKEYLGMATLSADGTVVEEQYPKFSQFKKQVLDAVKADFAKLSKEDKTDIVFTDCSPVYKCGQTRGNPEALLFKVKRTALGKAHIDGKVLERKEQKIGKANKEPVIGDLFAHVNTTESPKIKIVKGGEDKWQSFQAMIIDPSQQALLKRFKFVGMKNDRFCVKATQEDFDLLRTLGVEDIAKEFFNCKGSYSPTFYRD